jgi:predicted dienelactone hydrolase
MMRAMKIFYRYKYWYLGLLQLALVALPQLARPGHAAERVIFSVGAFERSISIASIEAYIQEGRVTDELAPLIAQIDPATLAQSQELLSQRLDVDVTTVAQVVYSPQGEFLLERAGKVFRTGARLSGKQGLSGAAILSAADDEGLSVLNMIRYFPTPVLRIDLKEGESIARQATKAFEQSRQALELVEQLSLQRAGEPFPEGVSANDLNALVTKPGAFQVKRASIKLKAAEPPVDIYLPESLIESQRSRGEKYPAVVISHGVGSSRVSYAYLAQFLAEHGFAVINVEHPGSNEVQIDNFVEGLTRRVVPDDEFINRPRLISQVLLALEARSQFNNSLSTIDFNNVGVIGQSFGGYTALAVAGAPLNLASLRATCPPDFSIDISLLLQCQAVSLGDLQQSNIPFKDSRIRAVIAINPISDAVFGPESLSQVDVPVLMIAGSADTVAPALEEQIRPFTWLTTPARYLLVMEGATHFSTIGSTGSETFQFPEQIIGPVPEIAQEYTQVMSLAFLSLYLKADSRYQPIFTSAFTTRFSRPEMPLSLISELGSDQLPPRP